jgi:hypothetical protein
MAIYMIIAVATRCLFALGLRDRGQANFSAAFSKAGLPSGEITFDSGRSGLSVSLLLKLWSFMRQHQTNAPAVWPGGCGLPIGETNA